MKNIDEELVDGQCDKDYKDAFNAFLRDELREDIGLRDLNKENKIKSLRRMASYHQYLIDDRKTYQYDNARHWFDVSPAIDGQIKELSKKLGFLKLEEAQLINEWNQDVMALTELDIEQAEEDKETLLKFAKVLHDKDYASIDDWMQNSGKNEKFAKKLEMNCIILDSLKQGALEDLEVFCQIDPYLLAHHNKTKKEVAEPRPSSHNKD